MQRPTARLQVEDLESRTVPSASLLRPVFGAALVSHAAHDIGLPGAIHGTLTARPGMPDTGAHYTVSGSGWLLGLGQVSVTGSLQGTGFIAQGHESPVRPHPTGGLIARAFIDDARRRVPADAVRERVLSKLVRVGGCLLSDDARMRFIAT